MSIVSNHSPESIDRKRPNRKPRPKPARSIEVLVRPLDGATGVVRITVGKTHADYFINELPSGYGRGFAVEKISVVGPEEIYHVNIDPNHRSCECKGYLRHQHCKHVEGLAALAQARRL